MTRPRNIHSILGTQEGDKFLSHPASANDLYRSLVGTPMLDSITTAIGGEREAAAPWDVFSPIPELTVEPHGPIYIASERVSDLAMFSSHDVCPGVGYPSCSRMLARVVKPMRDPNGYYRYLGVRPDATKKEIRNAVRKKYRQYHPDTGKTPDTDEFNYVREIAAVLLSERRRKRYDNLQPGEKWLDSRIASQLPQNDPIVMEFVQQCDEQQAKMAQGGFQRVRVDEETFQEGAVGDGGVFREDRQQAMRNADSASGNDHYDWYSDGERYGDRARAQLWYHHLVAVAPIFSYRRAIRVWLQEGGEPNWSEFGGILRIPRTWSIGRAEAFALFSVVVR